MEILIRNVISEALPDRPVKNIYLCSSPTIEMLAAGITPTSPNFGLLLAIDAQAVDASQIVQLAKSLANKGLAYLCAWDPDGVRVYDNFDDMYAQSEH